MYIIDKNKDYYDYLSHIYGVDKKVVYDRRKSVIITDETLCKKINSISFSYRKESFIILEIGFTQYLIRCFNVYYTGSFDPKLNIYPEFVECDLEIKRVFKDKKHHYSTPMSINYVELKYNYSWKNWRSWENKTHYNFEDSYTELIKNIIDKDIKNPILKDTQITSLINPEEIWIELQNYISSLNNDKDIDLNLTDKEKAEIHGFDKKSFRNPIK